MIFLYFCGIGRDFSFFISYFIWVLSLFFSVSLARDLSILFTPSKNQLLVLLIFTIFFKISTYFLPDLYYLLPSTDFRFFCSYFYNSRWYVRLFIWDFSCFLRKSCITMNFPLRTAFAASHRFCMVVFSLSFVSRYLFNFLFDFLVDPLVFYSRLFSLCVIVFFLISFPVVWFLVSCCFSQRRCLK